MPLLIGNPSRPRRAKQPVQIALDLTVAPYAGAPLGAVNPGEAIFLTPNNAAASLANAGTANVNTSTFLGVSNDAYPPQVTTGVYTPLPVGDAFGSAYIGMYDDGDHLFYATVGDIYQPYASIYLGANARTITTAAVGTRLGFVSPDQRQSIIADQPAPAAVGGVLNPPATWYVFGTAAQAGTQIYISIRTALGR